MFRVMYLTTILSLTGIAAAQTQVDLRTQSKGVDFQGAPYTRPLKTASALPATCAPNELLLLTSAPAGNNIYACMTANTWVLEGGVSQGIQIQNGGSPVGALSTENFVPGRGIINAITSLGPAINIQQSVDTSVVLSAAGQQSGQSLLCPSASGSGSTYSCSMTPTLATYTRGMVLNWQPDVTTTGLGATLNVDLLGPVPVTEADGVSNPVVADILGGRLYSIWYDGSVFRLPPMASGGAGNGSALVGAPNLIFATDSSGSSVDTAGLRSLTTADLPPSTRTRGFHVVFGGSDIVAGSVVYVTMPYACTATGYVLAADPGGTATVKLWKAADGASLPTITNSISNVGFALSTGNRIHGTNLADLSTTSWAAYDTTAVLLAAVSNSPNHVDFMLECDQ